MKRDHWQRRIEQLDPDVEFLEIYRIMAGHEFPWDMTQSLGLALYRTYAVPSIGELLAQTGEFERRTHKRYADTGLILDALLTGTLRIGLRELGLTSIALLWPSWTVAIPDASGGVNLGRNCELQEMTCSC